MVVTSENLPLISVIIPTYNMAKTVATAIQSILDQTYTNTEIIVIDDNSDDNTEQVVKTFTDKYKNINYYRISAPDKNRVNVRGRNINAGWRARNYGFEKSRGQWIAFQDADDASLLNRLEIQYKLAQKYAALHISTGWIQYKESLINKKVNISALEKDGLIAVKQPEDILNIARKSRGILMIILGKMHQYIPFEIKRMRFINKLFFGNLDPYPGTGHCLVKREVMEKILFYPTEKRVWPSFMGRGADRDFNFRVATTFKKSVTSNIPVYLWRVDRDNPEFPDFEKYLV